MYTSIPEKHPQCDMQVMVVAGEQLSRLLSRNWMPPLFPSFPFVHPPTLYLHWTWSLAPAKVLYHWAVPTMLLTFFFFTSRMGLTKMPAWPTDLSVFQAGLNFGYSCLPSPWDCKLESPPHYRRQHWHYAWDHAGVRWMTIGLRELKTLPQINHANITIFWISFYEEPWRLGDGDRPLSHQLLYSYFAFDLSQYNSLSPSNIPNHDSWRGTFQTGATCACSALCTETSQWSVSWMPWFPGMLLCLFFHSKRNLSSYPLQHRKVIRFKM